MKTKQTGFTLIELVVVIVLLGIVGAVASSRFQDLAGQAQTATTGAVAAEISGGLKTNYGLRSMNSTLGTAVNGATNAALCTDAIMDAFMDGITLATDPDYGVTAGAGDCTGGTGSTFTCGLDGPGTATATIYGVCIL